MHCGSHSQPPSISGDARAAGARAPCPAAAPEVGKVIQLNPGVTVTAPGSVARQKTRVSRSQDLGRVRWKNATTIQQKIQFSQADWIFEGPYQSSITVEGKKHTDWFTIRGDVPPGIEHPYGVVPLLSGPPGEPSVTSDP